MSVYAIASWLCLLFFMQAPLHVTARVGSRGSAGIEFILCVTEAYNYGAEGDEVELIVTNPGPDSATVKVDTPIYAGDLDWSATVTIAPGESKIIEIPKDIRGADTGKENKGIHVVATSPMVASVIDKARWMSDTYLALPLPMLGLYHFAATYLKYPEIMVVATQDNTSVTVTFPRRDPELYLFTHDGYHYRTGDTLSFTLNKFETFQIISRRNDARFTGASIVSDKPVGVLSGNRHTNIETSGADHLMEMLLSTIYHGNYFISSHVPNMNRGDIIQIMASEPDTMVTAGDYGPFPLLDAGDYVEIDMPHGAYARISATRPVSVYMISKSYSSDGDFNGDPSFTMLQPAKLFSNSYIFATPEDVYLSSAQRYFANTITVAILKDKVDGLLLDDAPTTWESIDAVDGAPDMVHLWKNIEHGVHTLRHADTSVRFGAIMSGTSIEQISSYLNPAGFGSVVYECDIAGDPHVERSDAKRFTSLAMPCHFGAVFLRIINEIPLDGSLYSEIEIHVTAGNSQKTVAGRYYTSDVKVDVMFVNGSDYGPKNTYFTSERRINAGDPWEVLNPSETMGGRIKLTYDPSENLATLAITESDVLIQFRPVDRSRGIYRQKKKPGLFMQVGDEDIHDASSLASFPLTMCGTAGDVATITDIKKLFGIKKKDVGALAALLTMYFREPLPDGDQDPYCMPFLHKLYTNCSEEMKSDDRIIHSQLVDCTLLSAAPKVSMCFNETNHVMLAAMNCLDFVCNDDCGPVQDSAAFCPAIGDRIDLTDCSAAS